MQQPFNFPRVCPLIISPSCSRYIVAPHCLLNKDWDCFSIILWAQASPYPSNLIFYLFFKHSLQTSSLTTWPHVPPRYLCCVPLSGIVLPDILSTFLHCFPSKCVFPSGVVHIQPPPYSPFWLLQPSLIAPNSESAETLLYVHGRGKLCGETRKHERVSPHIICLFSSWGDKTNTKWQRRGKN